MAEPACKRRVAVPPAGEAEPRGTARLARARPAAVTKAKVTTSHTCHILRVHGGPLALFPCLKLTKTAWCPKGDHIIPHGADVRVVVDLAVKREDSSPVPYQKNLTRSIETRGRPQNTGTRAG